MSRLGLRYRIGESEATTPMLNVLLLATMCCGATPVQAPQDPSIVRMGVAIARPPAPLHQAIARATTALPLARQTAVIKTQRDSIWNGLLIGAGAGAVGGYIWARQQCGTNDPECFTISATAGVLGGAGIGAVIGAILDALS
jgi:hypothetical protein